MHFHHLDPRSSPRSTNALQIFDEIFSQRASGRSIPMNFFESETGYVVRAALPGFSKEQISIEIDGATLTVSATREPALPPEGSTFLRDENFPSTLSRSIILPEKIDAEGASASSVDGILELTLPKLAPSKRLVKIV